MLITLNFINIIINTYKRVNNMEQQIVIKPYQKDWYEEYLIEKEKFISLFGGECIAIEYIGSTSVQGLGAKPLIDMMIGVTDLQITEKRIEDLLKIDMSMFQKKHLIDVFLEKENGELVPIICMFIFIIVTNGKTIFYFETF